MKLNTFLDGIAWLISLHGVAAYKGREHGSSTHQLRVFLVIHWLGTKRFNVTRRKVDKCSYLWRSSINPTVELLVDMGLIETVKEPKYHLNLPKKEQALL